LTVKNHFLTNYILINRKERWGLSLYGWLVLILVILVVFYAGFRGVYQVLAPTQRETAKVLVVEGFVSDYVLYEAIREFRHFQYSMLITTGTPLEYGDLLAAYKNTATIAGISLIKLGFDSTKLAIVGTTEYLNDRTFNSAKKLKQWLQVNMPEIRSVNVMTIGVHAGRSRLLFQAALGDNIKVGIISVANLYYGPNSWWKSSKGFRETVNEAIGYFYVKYFFRPY